MGLGGEFNRQLAWRADLGIIETGRVTDEAGVLVEACFSYLT